MTSKGNQKLFNIYLFRQPVIYAPILLGALVALLAPADVLDRISWMKVAIDYLQSIYPAMASYVKKSEFPQVAGLYFFIMAMHAPFHIPYVYKEFKARSASHRQEWNAGSSGKMRFVISAVVVGPMLTVFLVFFNPGYDLAWMPLNSSRWALAGFGWIVAGAAAVVVLTTSVLWVWGVVRSPAGPNNQY